MPRPIKSKVTASAMDAASLMAPEEVGFGASTVSKDGHVSECSDASPLSVEIPLARGFGTGEGMCSCARCLRKSAPFTTDYR